MQFWGSIVCRGGPGRILPGKVFAQLQVVAQVSKGERVTMSCAIPWAGRIREWVTRADVAGGQGCHVVALEPVVTRKRAVRAM